jgi:hypothetical protein
MAYVSKKFAQQVKTYDTDGVVIGSAEGRGISSSPASLKRGKELSRKNLRRVSRLSTSYGR